MSRASTGSRAEPASAPGAAFDAWELPRWIAVGEVAEVAAGAGGPRVRHPAPDPAWFAKLATGLAERGVRGRPTLGRVGGAGAVGAEGATASVLERVRVLGRVGARFLDPDDPLRAEALRRLPEVSGLSAPMAEAVLDGMAADWVPERLERLVREELGAELGPSGRMGHFQTGARGSSEGGRAERRVMTVGPGLLVQLVAGSVPGVGVNALLRGLLVGAPTLLKPGLGDVVLPVLFARALRQVTPELADELAVVYWPGGSEGVEQAVLARAEVVVAYGGDETVARLRASTPATTRFVGYHHREGIGIVGAEALTSPEAAEGVADEVARATALFDQRGCVSPRTVFVEDAGGGDADAGDGHAGTAAGHGELDGHREGGAHPRLGPADFAERLAGAFERLERLLPSGTLDDAERAALQQLRGTAELLAASGLGCMLRHGGDRPWTVVYDQAERIESACVGRVVVVRPFRSTRELMRTLSPRAHHLQTVGVAGLGERLEGLASELGRMGVSRVAPFRMVPFPPPWWHHDGRGPLRDLVRWVDLEGSQEG